MPDLSERASRLLQAFASSPSFDESRLEEARRLVSFITDERERAAVRIEALDALERAMRLGEERSAGNVVPFRRNELRLPEPSRPAARSLSMPLLIACERVEDARKAALETHAGSGRWAFVDFEDLDDGALETDEGLDALSGATIFVRDLGAMTEAAQDAIARRYLDGRLSEAPLLIAAALGASTRAVGSLLSALELRAIRPGSSQAESTRLPGLHS